MMHATKERTVVNETTEVSILDAVLAETESRLQSAIPETVAPAEVVSPVAEPAPAAKSSPAPAKPRGSARQKLRTRGVADGVYVFTYKGRTGKVSREGSQWALFIDGRRSKKTYETKRHAVNYARVVIDNNVDRQPVKKSKPVETVAEVAPAVQPAPAKPQQARQRSRGRRGNWRSPNAKWRQQARTAKQERYVGHLCDKLAETGEPIAVDFSKMNRGECSDLIDQLRAKLGAQPATFGCNIGPFRGGFCVCCGGKESR